MLECFSGQSVIAFAFFGRMVRSSLASAGVSKEKARRGLIDKFYDLGHSRIVMLVREERLSPTLGLAEQRFIEQLEEKGIQASEYNLPAWGDNP